MSERHRYYLERMGIGVWTPRRPVPFGPRVEVAAMASDPLEPPPQSAATGAADSAAMPGPVTEPLGLPAETVRTGPPPIPDESLSTWDELEARVATCTVCAQLQGRTQTVFGVGHREAHWMFVGEAPGEQEDLQGEPFVGRAGQLLNEMIRAVGLSREEVYIANVLKCRPPKNRDPLPEEAAACEGYLRMQLRLVRPRIIVAVGRIAAQNLLKTGTPIGKLRGQVHTYENIPLVVTYHPAYLLRSQTEKRRAWEDLKLALRTYRRGASEP